MQHISTPISSHFLQYIPNTLKFVDIISNVAIAVVIMLYAEVFL